MRDATSTVIQECESCGDEYLEHPAALEPHLCATCEGLEAEERFLADPDDSEKESESK